MHLGSRSWLLLLRFVSAGVFDFLSKRQKFDLSTSSQTRGHMTWSRNLCRLSDLNFQTFCVTFWLNVNALPVHLTSMTCSLHLVVTWLFGEGSSTLALTLENFAFDSSTRKQSNNWMSLSGIINVPRSFKPSSPHLMLRSLRSLRRTLVISHRWSCL